MAALKRDVEIAGNTMTRRGHTTKTFQKSVIA
jgi:hypothetical protein